MIGKIGPLVQAGLTSKLSPLLHLLGGALGGLVTGVALAFVGVVLAQTAPDFKVLAAGSLGLLAAWTGLVDLRCLRGPRLERTRQTPGSWDCSLGERPAMFAWGFDLGLGVTTRLPYHSLLVLLAFALLSGQFWTPVLVMALYGIARTSVVWGTVLAAGPRFAEACTLYNKRQETLRLLVGAMSMGLSTIFVLNAVFAVSQ